MHHTAVQIEGVTKRFGDKVAVRDLDLNVPEGAVCGFLGPNGAGKTTTIRMIMSIFYPDRGRIRVLDGSTALAAKDRIGYLPEERGVYRKMKVGDMLAYIARLKGLRRRGLDRRIAAGLERVGLPEVRGLRCEELSKGMQQKVQFLATIIHDPELVILDEPFSGLDPLNARLLRDLILDLKHRGKTIIFSSHVLHQAEQLCDRIFMINRGAKVLDGSIDAIRSEHQPHALLVEPRESHDWRHLADLPGVADVRPTANTGTFELRLEATAGAQAVMAEAAQALPLERIERKRPSLEDIFVHLAAPQDSEDMLRAWMTEGTETSEALGDA